MHAPIFYAVTDYRNITDEKLRQDDDTIFEKIESYTPADYCTAHNESNGLWTPAEIKEYFEHKGFTCGETFTENDLTLVPVTMHVGDYYRRQIESYERINALSEKAVAYYKELVKRSDNNESLEDMDQFPIFLYLLKQEIKQEFTALVVLFADDEDYREELQESGERYDIEILNPESLDGDMFGVTGWVPDATFTMYVIPELTGDYHA